MQSSNNSLYKKILYTFAIVVLYRIGSFITIPGIDAKIASEFSEQTHTGIIAMLNVFSGGALTRMSIFTLSIYPYITASIIMQLLSFIYPSVKELNKQGQKGRDKINQITKYITILIAAFQAYGAYYATLIFDVDGKSAVIMDNIMLFKLSTVITLVCGSIILLWLASRISSKGIGNGSSVIICASILSAIPQNFFNIFSLSKKGAISNIALFSIIVVFILCTLIIIFIEQSYRKISIQYPKQNQFIAGQQNKNYLPFKINMAGVMPPIFTNTVIMGPFALFSFFKTNTSITNAFNKYLGQGSIGFFLLSLCLIFVFSFFYTSNAMNTQETANNLQKNGAYIAGRRPGKETVSYLNRIIKKLTILGSIYLCIICLTPDILLSIVGIKISLGTTSILIVINVILDIIEKIQMHNLENQYSSMMTRKIKIRARR